MKGRDKYNRKLIRIPQGDLEKEAVNTDFYHFLTVVLTSAPTMRERPKFSYMVEVYLMADFDKVYLAKTEVAVLKAIWDSWWYAQYDEVDNQEYIL